ncbi:hypothetical protein [Cyanothece sp. BG0011]|uniref:hypothetical protein n=1 Tax=Cyanothece sp. BG0011 TaxID=2082950 RepID=UPI000D1F1BA6|nr:hypothetical protein [Cyanothece sp. BG0011]
MSRTKTNWIRYKDVIIKYDHDFQSKQRLLRTRLIIEDGKNNVVTPYPPLFNDRVQQDVRPRSIAKRPNNFVPRNISFCFISNNLEVTRNLINPYSASDFNHNLIIKEVRDNFDFATFGIQGESYDSTVEGILL